MRRGNECRKDERSRFFAGDAEKLDFDLAHRHRDVCGEWRLSNLSTISNIVVAISLPLSATKD